MKSEPDLILILVIVFLLGSVATGVAQADFQFVSLIGNAFSANG